MAEFTEKRIHERHDYETPKVMYKKDSKDVYNYATITNYSQGGLYMKATEYMDIGQTVIVKMEEHRQNATGLEKYDYYYGQIRWIKNFHTNPYDSSYGYGIEYDRPVSYS
jgi:hypothetical protein